MADQEHNQLASSQQRFTMVARSLQDGCQLAWCLLGGWSRGAAPCWIRPPTFPLGSCRERGVMKLVRSASLHEAQSLLQVNSFSSPLPPSYADLPVAPQFSAPWAPFGAGLAPTGSKWDPWGSIWGGNEPQQAPHGLCCRLLLSLKGCPLLSLKGCPLEEGSAQGPCKPC